MKINIGSKNKAKSGAIRELIPLYPMLKGAEVIERDVASGVGDQPHSLDETIRGAMNRAKAAFENCDLSFGIESGLMHVPHTKTGVMDLCVCAIYDGKEFHLGTSSAFECPPLVVKYMHEDGLDMNDASHKAGLTEDLSIGSGQGLIGLLTKNRVDRLAYTKQAIYMAMIHLENAEIYKK